MSIVGTIVKIHGNSGSGKTTIIRNLFEHATVTLGVEKLGGNPKKPEAYKFMLPGVMLPIYVLGSYENTCGGVDTIPIMDDLVKLIHHYAPLGNVIYEGLLISTYYGTAGREMNTYGRRHVWAFLDTPLEVCIERVKARRHAAGDERPFNEENTRNRHKPIENLAKKLVIMKANVAMLAHDGDPTGEIVSLLT